MTVDSIIQNIAEKHGGAWYMLFHVTDRGYKYLPTGDVLTSGAYLAIVRHFAPAPELSAEDRKRNNLRAKAVAKGGGYF